MPTATIDRRVRTEPTPEPLPEAEAHAVEPVEPLAPEPRGPFFWRDTAERIKRLQSHGATRMEIAKTGCASLEEIMARALAEEAGAHTEEFRRLDGQVATAREALLALEQQQAAQAAADRELDSARRQLGEAERALSRAIENAEGDKTAAADCERQLIDLWSKPVRDPYAEALCLQLSDFLVRARTLGDVRQKAVEAARARVEELRQRVGSAVCG